MDVKTNKLLNLNHKYIGLHTYIHRHTYKNIFVINLNLEILTKCQRFEIKMASSTKHKINMLGLNGRNM